MSHSRGLRGRTTGKRRRTEWFAGVGGTDVASVSASSSAILGSGVITSFGEETLVRTRGIFEAVLKTATESNSQLSRQTRQREG